MLKNQCNDLDLKDHCRMAPGGAGRILIIDVDADFRQRLRKVLHVDGFDVIESDTCENLDQILSEHVPDLVILEPLMPNVDGFTACEILSQHANTRRIPVIMVTSLEDCDIIDWAFDLGVFDFMTKPIHETILRNRIRVLINQVRETSEYQNDHNKMMSQVQEYESELRKFKSLFREELIEHKRTRRLVNHFKQAFQTHYPLRKKLTEGDHPHA
ncbi:MAG: response regulator [Magnetococcales bacterium]|nr:response regulator [Magnetococcales bacterium]MBF0151411.1 response regulator [Magnetococcales bacterium]MBF0173540.1 response regulator [Magnetococcales bacterium]MBF0632427.1 response regulator [Magnetococcales bacterium]